MWTIDVENIADWLDQQDVKSLALIEAAIDLLEEKGPSLGRPLVDTIKGSNYKNLKELRPGSSGGSEIRILFIFDPSRDAIMLVAGDKSKGKWSKWYKGAIPKAERIYTNHLKMITKQD